MILGCGVDLMEIARFEREVARRGHALIEELFTPGELAWCRRRRRAAEGYAMAYAAKEALFKALGTGKAGRMAWHDVDIAWPAGAPRPSIALAGETAATAGALGADAAHVSMTATREHAAAWVVVTARDRDKGQGARDKGQGKGPASTKPTEEDGEPDGGVGGDKG